MMNATVIVLLGTWKMIKIFAACCIVAVPILLLMLEVTWRMNGRECTRRITEKKQSDSKRSWHV